MSISGIGGSAGVYALQQSSSTSAASAASRPPRPPQGPGEAGGAGRGGGHIEVAAEALGLSVDEVTSGLTSGSSLAELAEQQGVAREDLVAALVANAPEELLASADVTEIVGNLVDQVGMGGPGGGRPPHGATGVFGENLTGDQQATVDALSELLEMSSSTLLTTLRSGTSLSSLLKDAGISFDALAGSVQAGLLIDTTS